MSKESKGLNVHVDYEVDNIGERAHVRINIRGPGLDAGWLSEEEIRHLHGMFGEILDGMRIRRNTVLAKEKRP